MILSIFNFYLQHAVVNSCKVHKGASVIHQNFPFCYLQLVEDLLAARLVCVQSSGLTEIGISHQFYHEIRGSFIFDILGFVRYHVGQHVSGFTQPHIPQRQGIYRIKSY